MSHNFGGPNEYPHTGHLTSNQTHEMPGGSAGSHMHPLFPFHRMAGDPLEASQVKTFPPHDWSSENPDMEYKPFLFVNYD